jgi:hypothetical protein
MSASATAVLSAAQLAGGGGRPRRDRRLGPRFDNTPRRPARVGHGEISDDLMIFVWMDGLPGWNMPADRCAASSRVRGQRETRKSAWALRIHGIGVHGLIPANGPLSRDETAVLSKRASRRRARRGLPPPPASCAADSTMAVLAPNTGRSGTCVIGEHCLSKAAGGCRAETPPPSTRQASDAFRIHRRRGGYRAETPPPNFCQHRARAPSRSDTAPRKDCPKTSEPRRGSIQP